MDPQSSSDLRVGQNRLLGQEQHQLRPLDKGMGYVTLAGKSPGLIELLARKRRTIERQWSRHREVPP
jgi:hypothetical protein